jgi:hypothetical protein
MTMTEHTPAPPEKLSPEEVKEKKREKEKEAVNKQVEEANAAHLALIDKFKKEDAEEEAKKEEARKKEAEKK